MGCARVVVWLVYCVCVDVSAVEGECRVVGMGRCARGRCRCVYMFPAAMPWVWGGVFWFVVMAWDGMFVFVARCVASGGVCDELGLCGLVFVMLSGSSVCRAPAPIGKFRVMPMVCSVPCLVPSMYGCVSLCFWLNERSETCKSLQAVWGPGVMPVFVCFSLSPCTYVQDASTYLHLSHLIIM